MDFSTVPVPVPGITDAIAIETSYGHACAVLSTGAISCWGDNGVGQLGGGSATDPSPPVTVVGVTDAVAVATTFSSTCALRTGGAVSCWGTNGTYGTLGNGTNVNSATPVTVVAIAVATSVDLAALHSCALAVGGAVRCWGYNGSGQLGNGTQMTSGSPLTAVGL